MRRADEPEGPHPMSRLMREEDELGEGDDGTFLAYIPRSSLYSLQQSLQSTRVPRSELLLARSQGKSKLPNDEMP